jgi:hypothetical protein
MGSSVVRLRTAAAIAVASLLFVALAGWLSLDPAHYYHSSPAHRANWEVDLPHVLMFLGFMLVESFVAAFALALRWPLRFTVRCALSATVLILWAMVMLPSVIHMPAYVLVHHVWLSLLLFVVVLALIMATLRGLWAAVVRRAPAS